MLPTLLLLGLTLHGPAIAPAAAAWAGPGDDPATPAGRRGYDFLGTVHQVNATSRTIVVKGSKKDGHRLRTIRLDDQTEIVKSRRAFDAAKIRPEMRIWVYLRDDEAGRPTNLARRLTIADPYPDIYGRIEKVDAKEGSLSVSRQYKGSRQGDRRQVLRVRVDSETEIVRGGAPLALSAIPVGARVAITSRRDAANKKLDVAARVTVWRDRATGEDEDSGDNSADEAGGDDDEREGGPARERGGAQSPRTSTRPATGD